MTCSKCECDNLKRHGKTRDGQQRYRCRECGATVSEPKPLAGLATDINKACQALSMLLEGMSVRATARLTGLDKGTILRLMIQAGEQCRTLMDTIQQQPFADVQVDEQWAFVGCKEKTAERLAKGPDKGDAYHFTAIDRGSRLVICFHLGKREPDATWQFIEKLYRCVSGRPQISTDGFTPYLTAIPLTFRHDVDYGQIVKKYGTTDADAARRYSPATITAAEKHTVCGSPTNSRICTSHVERHNLSNRMQVRRLTRLTNGFSKKWENHEAMLALWFAFYNWCRPHLAFKQKGQKTATPAMKAGLADEPWTIERLLTEAAKATAA